MVPLKTDTYHASVLTRPGSFRLEEKPVPELQQGEALVKIRYAGICGTDIAIYSGSYEVPLPLTLGHEWSGTVVSLRDTHKQLIGQPVTGEINNSCLSYRNRSRCAACQNGLPTHCSKRTVTGIINKGGAFAEYLVVPVRNLHLLPSGVSPEVGVLTEPLAAAIQTFEMTPIHRGSSVVVLGVGRLGILVTLVAKTMGAHVIAVCRSSENRHRAALLGVDTMPPDDPSVLIASVKKLTKGLGADVVVEATGNPDNINLAIEMVRSRGTVALKSTPGVPARFVNLTRVAVEEINIQGSRCGPFKKAVAFLSGHQATLSRLITTVLPLEELEDGLSLASEGGKILIKCG